MDPQRRYEGIRDLLDRLAGRLPDAEVETFRSLHDVGEPIYVLNLLCAGLVKWQTPISRSERAALATLIADRSGNPERFPYLADQDGTLGALNVVDSD